MVLTKSTPIVLKKFSLKEFSYKDYKTIELKRNIAELLGASSYCVSEK